VDRGKGPNQGKTPGLWQHLYDTWAYSGYGGDGRLGMLRHSHSE